MVVQGWQRPVVVRVERVVSVVVVQGIVVVELW